MYHPRWLGELGRRDESLTAIQEAVTVRRALAEAHPDAYLPNLAMSLNNLANLLESLGRSAESDVVRQEVTLLDTR